jgi:hypothetical protein
VTNGYAAANGVLFFLSSVIPLLPVMVAPSLSLIFDDTALGATYGGGSWTTSTLPSWYNGSCLYPAFAIGGNGTGTASFSFQG